MGKISRITIVVSIVSLSAFFFVLNKEQKGEETSKIMQNANLTQGDDLQGVVTQKNDELKIDTSAKFKNLEKNIKRQKGTFGLYVKNLTKNEKYEINSNVNFLPLSLYKIPVAYAVGKKIELGEMQWDQTLTYTIDDYFEGLGTIGSSYFGTQYTVEKLVDLMLRESDNTAQKMLKNYLGEDYLKDSFIEISNNSETSLYKDDGVTTPHEISEVIENMFYTDKLNQEDKDKILDFMFPTSYDNRLSPYLDENLIFYHKVGIFENSFHDCGVLKGQDKEMVVCLMSKETDQESLNNVYEMIGEFLNSL